MEELGKLSRRLPSAEGKHSAAGIDHPRAIPTPCSEAKPIRVFFSWGAGLAGGSHSWSLTGNRCGGEGGGGGGGFSGGGCCAGQSSGAGEIKQPLSTVGGGRVQGDSRHSKPLLLALQRLLTAGGSGRATSPSALCPACHFPEGARPCGGQGRGRPGSQTPLTLAG